MDCHILLPANSTPLKLVVDGEERPFETSKIRNSLYVDFKVNKGAFLLEIEI